MVSLVIAPGSKIESYMQVDLEEQVSFRDPEPNQITCFAGGDEMLRIGPDGFWVRGVKVAQDEGEAMAVYNAIKEWLAWANLQRQ
jgi:hypothetical protein